MKYPRWNNYCTIKRNGDWVEVTNHLLEESFILPVEMIMFGKKLDGKTAPSKIDPSLSRTTVHKWLNILNSLDCTRNSRAMLISTGTFLLGLYSPDKIKPSTRRFAWFYNKALQILFLPMLVLGIYYYSTQPHYGNGGMYIGMIPGLVIGLFLHEVGHACATLACPKGKFFEMGVGVSYFIMPMAYVLVDVTQVKNRFQRVQVNLAGIETNFFLCGLFLFIAGLSGDSFQEVFLGAAVNNGFLGLLNLVFSNGIDGACAMGELLGDSSNNLISKSRKLVWNKKKKQKVLNMGIDGYAIVASAYVLQLLQLTLPALFMWSILSFIEVF